MLKSSRAEQIQTVLWIADWCVRAGLLDPSMRKQSPGEWQYIPGSRTCDRKKFIALKGWAVREASFQSLINQIDDYATEVRVTARHNSQQDPLFGIRSIINLRRAIWFVSQAHQHRLQRWVDDLDELLI